MAKKEEKATRKKDPGPNAFEPKAHQDAGLNKTQMKGLYEQLIKERERVAEGLERHLNEAVLDIDQLADEVDVATRHTEQAYLMRYADKERKLLNEIDHALAKMKAGEYGLCEGTEEPIGFARLSVRPWTRYSVEHKEMLERLKSQHA